MNRNQLLESLTNLGLGDFTETEVVVYIPKGVVRFPDIRAYAIESVTVEDGWDNIKGEVAPFIYINVQRME